MTNPGFSALHLLDQLRRARGAWLDRIGLGPLEHPWREVLRVDGMRLRAYGEPGGGPVLLIVPAPIKRGYIWDLVPDRSVVGQARAAGFDVGLVEWLEPEADAAAFGLDDAERLIGVAVDAMADRHEVPGVLLAGHSLGGTLAAIHAARQPERVRGLVLVEAPLRFKGRDGSLAALAKAAPHAPEALQAAFGSVPGSVVSAAGMAADPVEFLVRPWLDSFVSSMDQEARTVRLRIMRWALDEFAMPGQLFADVTGRLCRDDSFYEGTLVVGGRPAVAERIAMPVLAVIDPRSVMVPPPSVLPFLERTRGAWTVRWHGENEAGVPLHHVAPLVGREAHRQLWPEILHWAHAVWAGYSERDRQHAG